MQMLRVLYASTLGSQQDVAGPHRSAQNAAVSGSCAVRCSYFASSSHSVSDTQMNIEKITDRSGTESVLGSYPYLQVPHAPASLSPSLSACDS
jgi:hypothetical protein